LVSNCRRNTSPILSAGETTVGQVYTGCTVTSLVPRSGRGLLDAAEWYTMETRSTNELMCSHYLSAIVREPACRWVDVELTWAGTIRPEAMLLDLTKYITKDDQYPCCKWQFRGHMEMYISNAGSAPCRLAFGAVHRSETIVDFATSRILNCFTV
jgi:hypothetical protein